MYTSDIIANKVKELARVNNVQLKDMFEELELNKNVMSNLYRGSIPRADNLAKMADYFDVSVDYLLGRTDNPKINE